ARLIFTAVVAVAAAALDGRGTAAAATPGVAAATAATAFVILVARASLIAPAIFFIAGLVRFLTIAEPNLHILRRWPANLDLHRSALLKLGHFASQFLRR